MQQAKPPAICRHCHHYESPLGAHSRRMWVCATHRDPWSPPAPYPSQTRALSQMRTCTNGNTNASVCVSTRTHTRVLICCLFGFFCFVFAVALLGQPSPLILGKRMMLRDTYERVHNMLPFSSHSHSHSYSCWLSLRLAVLVCICVWIYAYKLENIGSVVRARQAQRRKASHSVENKQQNNNNKSSTSHAKAGYRAETPEQTPSRARADPETDANATASTQSTHHSQLPSQSTPLAATSQRQTNQKAMHSGTKLR